MTSNGWLRGSMVLGLVLGLAWGFGLTGLAVAGDDREDGRRIRRSRVVEMVERVRNSVVNISASQHVKVHRPIFGTFFEERHSQRMTNGSGFVIHKDGYIVTNEHVVARSTDHRVRFANGQSYDAVIVAIDPQRDLAILRISPESPLVPLKLGRSDDLMVGEDAIAIGNPFGLENTVTRGVLSALNRDLEINGDVIYEDLIQTDASINPGNSGGPLFNILGELIGVNTAVRAEAENVGFAIPVDQLRALMPDMLDITHLYQVEVGIRVFGDLAEVVELVDDSPAAKAGARLGDRITGIAGETVLRDVDYYIAMLGQRAGDTVDVSILRDGQPGKLTMQLTEVPKLDGAELAWQKLGMRLKPIPPAVARQFRLRGNEGLVISDIVRGGPAERHGIGTGELLVSLGRYRAWPLETVAQLLEATDRGDPVDLGVWRFYNDGTVRRMSYRLFVQ